MRDRHFDNILIQDNKKMLHIDFSYLLGGRPPVDGPPISLSPGMEQGMKAAGIWDNFIDMSVDAFKSLRNNCDDIIRLASIMFPKAGLDSRSVQNYLKGSMSLNLAAEEDDALLSVRTQIVNSTEDFGNWFKEYTHENVLPVWYNLLKEGFPPAQSAMEAYSGWKQERENWLAETKVKIEDEDALEIS